jgi:hypothetical protein
MNSTKIQFVKRIYLAVEFQITKESIFLRNRKINTQKIKNKKELKF